MKKKVLVLSLPIVLDIIFYLAISSLAHQLTKNSTQFVNWLQFGAMLIINLYLLALCYLYGDIILLKIKNTTMQLTHVFIGKIHNIFKSVKNAKIIKYIQGNEKIYYISRLGALITSLPAAIITIASIVNPTFYIQFRAIYIIGIFLMFLSVLILIIKAISCTNYNNYINEVMLTLLTAFIWACTGTISILNII